jgi:TPR repeat protein
MYDSGKGVLRDYKQAVHWWEKSANQGNANLQVVLGDIYWIDKNYAKAIYWYKKAIDQDYAPAQLSLGYMYMNGYGVLKDLKKAKYYTKQAYENKNASAEIKNLAKNNWEKFELWKY